MSAPVLDLAAGAKAAAAPGSLAFPGPAPTEKEEGAFGELLAQVTEQSDELAEEDPLAVAPAPAEKDEETDSDPAAAPLVFICPPLQLKPLPSLEVTTTVEAPVETLPTSQDSAPELAVCAPPLPDSSTGQETKGDPNRLIEIVRPKNEKAGKEAKETNAAKSKIEGSKRGELSLEGFDLIDPELTELTQLEGLKRPEMPPQSAASPPRGTVVAQQEKVMRNGQKSAEIAPTIEQKMPVGEHSRRVLPEQARFDVAGFVADTFARAKGEFSIEPPTREITVRSLESVELIETIRTEVTNLRQRGDATMTVVLKPDSGTELKLEVTVSRDGKIHATARCERGDFQSLNAQWPQLQQALAAQGIRVNDLSNPGNSHHHHNESSSAQNFNRGNNPQNRQEQHQANFEDELAASTPRYPTNNNLKATVAATRRWQSWA